MTAQQAVSAWQQRQVALLKQTYTRAWQQGASNYRSQYATPATATPLAAAPPTAPASTLLSRALSPVLVSLAAMGAQMATLLAGLTVATAIAEYLERNAWRLAGAVSIIWAAEQAGYAQAARADGLLLDWQLDPAVTDHCADCPELAALPPMPLDQWPTLPGEGATDCSMGCRCSLKAVAAPMPALTASQVETVQRISLRQPVLVAA